MVARMLKPMLGIQTPTPKSRSPQLSLPPTRLPVEAAMRYFVCVDGSQESLKAIETVGSKIKNNEEDLFILCSLWDYPLEFEEWPASSGFGAVPMFGKAMGGVTPEADYDHKLQAISEENKTREEATKRLLWDCKNQLVLMGVKDTRVTTVAAACADPRDDILQLAKNHLADMIVMGSRGLSDLKGWLVGSVSSYVMQNAECPVLIVKGKPATIATNQ